MSSGALSTDYLLMIITAILTGTIARWLVLKEDYRQYPSYPNGYLIHLVTGFVAASLGAVALPALLTKNFVAVTFLTLAIQQFRDVRKMEKSSMKDLENTEFTHRGDAYIDGIAKTFEARNYFALLVSLSASIGYAVTDYILDVGVVKLVVSVAVGFLVFYLLKRFSKGKVIQDIATVEPGAISIREDQLYVNDIFVSNLVGSDVAQDFLQKEGLAVVIRPKEQHYRIALDNYGQRQAILFEVTRALGVRRYAFTRKQFTTGEIAIAIAPILQDSGAMAEVVKNTPLLENTRKSHAMMQTNLVGEES
ncbi:MAG TPA: YIEGIA domain-containing protein [Bacilli bacterium]|nr:YIEGIA domain-containing protein [Bacilli bacterium]